MNWYPKLYLNNIKEITPQILKKHQLKGLILDVDNTLINLDRKMPAGVSDWARKLKAGA